MRTKESPYKSALWWKGEGSLVLREQNAQVKTFELYREVRLPTVVFPTVFSYDFSILRLPHFQKYKIAKDGRLNLEIHSAE